MSKDKQIGVLLGGPSEERAVSLRTGAAITAALNRQGYRVVAVDVGVDLPAVLIEKRIEVAVIALHGPLGEDGTVQGLLEVMRIPYTGSGVAASALCMDKGLCKRVLRDGGVATPPWREVFDRGGDPVGQGVAALREDPLPVFVKPVCSGSSVGVGRARTVDELVTVLAESFKVSHRVMAERAVEGVEVTLTILNGVPLPLIEIQPVQGFYDYSNKYTAGNTRYLIPSPSLSPAAERRAIDTGLAAYRLTGCRGLARVDMMMDAKGDPWVLEINTVPGLTETSLAPKAAMAAGISFDELVERILLGAALGSCGAA